MARLYAVEGNSQWLDGGSMFGNVPRPVWEKWMQPDSRGRIRLACRAMLIEHKGMYILCETGIGAFFDPKLADRYGVEESRHVLLDRLHVMGIGEEKIGAVILSHLHFDHAGGLLPAWSEISAGRDRLLFPNARYIAGRRAFERALKPHARDRASFIPGLAERLQASGRLTLVDGDRLPGFMDDHLSFRFSEGHTPGHMHTVFRGDQDTVFFAGDLIPGTAWVHLPVTMGYDRYPELLIDEKAGLYTEVVSKKWMVFFTHDPVVALAGITVDDKGRYSPVHTVADPGGMSI